MHFGTVILILCLAARFFNETSFAIMTCFTGESFPTIVRSICFSICTIASSVGGVLSPQMAYFGTCKYLWAYFHFLKCKYLIFCHFSLQFGLPDLTLYLAWRVSLVACSLWNWKKLGNCHFMMLTEFVWIKLTRFKHHKILLFWLSYIVILGSESNLYEKNNNLYAGIN